MAKNGSFNEVVQLILEFNESFMPIGNKQKAKPLAILWHEIISVRNKEDIKNDFFYLLAIQRYKAYQQKNEFFTQIKRSKEKRNS